ncbi:MAG: NUDIX hydrolase [Spirochaetaceae bacterium]|nr:NUDIX hydrolase [Spirochaetaceae bacterium]
MSDIYPPSMHVPSVSADDATADDGAASRLAWTEESSKTSGDFRIFSVRESVCRSPEGALKTFSVIDTRDWAMVVPVIETKQGKAFVMVRQWRHGARELSVEFPGGVLEAGEQNAEGAARELREETGFVASSVIKLGEMNPNPAIMSNRIHFYLAEDLTQTGKRELDEDEFVEVLTLPAVDVLQNMGRPPYIHALTAVALLFYLKRP